jgi:hypothetical protein
MEFLHATWKGTEPRKNWRMRGLVYVGYDGDRYIVLGCQDLEEHHEAALQLGKTALLTFRKR